MTNDPHLLIGVDLGMSCTGISYLNRAKGMVHVATFKNWKDISAEQKAPTRLQYPPTSYGMPVPEPESWGFACDPEEDTGVIQERFKVHLGNHDPDAPLQSEVERYYTDYLTCLYNLLRGHFTGAVLNGVQWDAAVIHFHFSFPTTWDSALVNTFRQLIELAGFCSRGGFKVFTSLTEPHAVAAYTLCQERIGQTGENMLILDAGGSTVDLCFVNIVNAERGQVNMSEIQPVTGFNCGSAEIDYDFQYLVFSQLQLLDERNCHDALDLDKIAWRMTRSSKFQSSKRSFGAAVDDDDIFKIKIPEIGTQLTASGELTFKQGELRLLFDRQVNKIIVKLDEAISSYQYDSSSAQLTINHVVVSGGLGSSTYVQQELEKYFKRPTYEALRNAQLHESSEPQLSVCLGLLEYALQGLNQSSNGQVTKPPPKMFSSLRTRASYGIASRRRVMSSWSVGKNPEMKRLQHVAENQNLVTKDADGQKWIDNCVSWFVRRGGRHACQEPIMFSFFFPATEDSKPEDLIKEIRIMTSLSKSAPDFVNNDVSLDCTLKVDLSLASKQSIFPKDEKWYKRRHMGGKHKREHHIKFWVEAVVDVADVSFRCRIAISETTKIKLEAFEDSYDTGGTQILPEADF